MKSPTFIWDIPIYIRSVLGWVGVIKEHNVKATEFSYRLSIQRRDDIKWILVNTLPFLIVKKEQAEEILAIMRFREMNGGCAPHQMVEVAEQKIRMLKREMI